MSEHGDVTRQICDVIYEMVNSLGAALPRTPELAKALDALVQADIEST